MPGQVQVIDSLNMTPVPSKHRNTVLRTVEFFDPSDARRIRGSFSTHHQGRYYSPRHRHNFDQVRYTVAGQVRYGRLLTRAGDCIYFPEGVPYGPTEIVSEESVTCTLQTQGPSWALLPTHAEEEAAADALAEIGTMDRASGRFQWPNGRIQDSYEAMWEQIAGQRMAYPRARYSAPCLLRSDAFAWQPLAGHAGAEVKPLACFNASGPALELVRLEAGATLPTVTLADHQVAGVLSGAVNYAGTRGAQGTFVYYPPGASGGAITAEDETILLLARLQAQASATAASWVA